MLSDLRYRLRALFNRRALDTELDSELRFHLERETDKLRARGLSASEARRQAHIAFGSVDSAKEQSRDGRGVALIETTLQDLRYAARGLRKAPGFAALVVLSLALGIGANTAIFSVVNAELLKPLPVRDPASLYTLEGEKAHARDYPLFTLLRQRGDVFSDIAAVSTTDRSNIAIGGDPNSADPRPASVHLVSGSYFRVLGVYASRGRMIGPEDDQNPSGHPVVVVSDAYARRRFGRADNAVDHTLTLNATTYTIIGVAPAEFTGDVVGHPADLWIPIMMQSEVMVERPGLLTNPRPPWIRTLARLARGVSAARASAILTIMYRQILTDRFVTKQTMNSAADIAKDSMVVTSSARGYAPERATITRPIIIMWGIVGLVLIIACVNVAGLLIARATTREREIATRLAIGAGRWRITRQLLAEGMLLAALGGGAGMLVAWAGVESLDRVVNSGLDPLTLNIAPDVRVLGLTVGVCVLTGLLCGFAPALRVSRLSLVPSLKSMQSASLRPRRGRLGLGQILVVTQVGLSLALVVAAGLFARTLVNLEHQSVGFDRSRVLLAWTAPTQAGLTKARLADLYDAAIGHVGRLPGVRAVAVSSRGILGAVGSGSPIRVPGYVARPTDDYFVSWNIVTPAFFSTAGIQMLAGRDFGPLDVASGQRVAIVSEALAKHYFGGESPIGKRFGMRIGTDFPLEVIGVAHDAVDLSVRSGGAEMIYLPYRQDAEHMSDMCVIVRTDGPPAALAEPVRRALHDVDSALPVVSVSAMDEQVSRTLVQERVIALLSGLFGALALALAAVGLYAIVAQSVATRSPELAIRLALGGARGDVLGLILRESLSVVGIGIVVGLAGAQLAARSIANQLFGVSTFDPWTVGVAVILMLLAAVLAAWAPARRAALTDPMNALRGG